MNNLILDGRPLTPDAIAYKIKDAAPGKEWVELPPAGSTITNQRLDFVLDETKRYQTVTKRGLDVFVHTLTAGMQNVQPNLPLDGVNPSWSFEVVELPN